METDSQHQVQRKVAQKFQFQSLAIQSFYGSLGGDDVGLNRDGDGHLVADERLGLLQAPARQADPVDLQ